MAEVNAFNGGNKRKKLDIDFDDIFASDSDDRPPDLIITSSENSRVTGAVSGKENQDYELRTKTNDQLNDEIKKINKIIYSYGPKLSDKGEKLKIKLRRFEAEFNRRKNIKGGGIKCEETIQLSDQSDDEGALWLKEEEDKKVFASSKFKQIFSRPLNQNDNKCVRTVVAFHEELSAINPLKEKKVKQNGQFSSKGRFKPLSSSKPKPFRCATVLGDSKKGVISNGGKKVNRTFDSSSRFVRNLWDNFTKKSAPQAQPSRKSSPKAKSLYHLVDDNIEEPDFFDTPYAEKLSDCMKDVTVYYPSRDDHDPVEVTYADMKCLEPGACLSSSIMNFYMRYLQQLTTSSENAICNYHLFNTYFYNKLRKLSYKEDSFLKFRKWWKSINIFEKAYILVPVHEQAHWSLVIICIPTTKDELGPIVLHLDSLGLHDSTAICFNIRRFVKEEWSYLQNSEHSLDLPMSYEIWKNLDSGILDKSVAVPQQKNTYDCGLFVLFYMERFIKEAPKRLTQKDLSLFSKQWFRPEEASRLRTRINNLLLEEFKIAKGNETISSPKC